MSALPTNRAQWHQRIWQLTWPVILANITIPMVGVADVAVMGQLPDPAYIGAVTVGAAMFSAVYWLFGFLRMGTTGLVAQAFGRQARREVTAIIVRAAWVAVVLGLIIVACQWVLAELLFLLFDADAKVAALADTYYRIRIYGAPALLTYLVMLGTLFGLQCMRETLILSVGFNVTNLALDIGLALGLDMGVAGVAVGTVISEWVAAGAAAWFVLQSLKHKPWSDQSPLSWPQNIWQLGAVKALFDLSGNLVIRTFFVQLPFFAGTVIATGLGNIPLAAHGVLMQLFFIMTYSVDGFAHTAETLAGYAFGAKHAEGLQNTTRYCAHWALAFALFTGLIYWLLGGHFIALLSEHGQVQSFANDYLLWVAVAPLLCVFAFLFDGIFIGTTHIREMRNAMFIAASIWALVLHFSIDTYAYHAVWLSMSVFMVSRSILLAFYYPRITRNALAG